VISGSSAYDDFQTHSPAKPRPIVARDFDNSAQNQGFSRLFVPYSTRQRCAVPNGQATDTALGIQDICEHSIQITAQILRKILYERSYLSEGFLVLQKEAAKKFSGFPRETLFSILAKPFFQFRILSQLRRTDFWLVPNVDSVLLSIRRRTRPLNRNARRRSYRDFVQYAFGRWKPNLKLAFKNVFTNKQWKRLARDLDIPLNATPAELSFEQWLGLYHGFSHRPRHDDS
jgi:hypothetical protein